MTWDGLARLWLHEPDSRALECAGALGLATSGSSLDELAAGFSELFLLNVYPYGSVFTDPSAELNGRFASWSASRYDRRGYVTAEFWDAGAPDHVGLCLGYLGHLEKLGETDADFTRALQQWLPVCALAVERDPSAVALYRELAATTRALLLREEAGGPGLSAAGDAATDESPDGAASGEEVHLSDVLAHLLAPARSGFFLSRARLGQIGLQSGMRLPFGGRYEVARALFAAAGESGRVAEVLGALSVEADAWDAAYAHWESEHPAWVRLAPPWRARIVRTRGRLAGMGDLLRRPLDLEYGANVPR